MYTAGSAIGQQIMSGNLQRVAQQQKPGWQRPVAFAESSRHLSRPPNWRTVAIGVGEVVFGIGAIVGSLIAGTAATAATGGMGTTIAVIGAGSGISSGIGLFALGMGEIATGLTGGSSLSRDVIRTYYDVPPVVDTINVLE